MALYTCFNLILIYMNIKLTKPDIIISPSTAYGIKSYFDASLNIFPFKTKDCVGEYYLDNMSLVEVHIHSLEVYFSFRNKGYGSAILKKILSSLKHTKYIYCTLQVDYNNIIAQHLYFKLGFYESFPRTKLYNHCSYLYVYYPMFLEYSLK